MHCGRSGQWGKRASNFQPDLLMFCHFDFFSRLLLHLKQSQADRIESMAAGIDSFYLIFAVSGHAGD